MTERPDAGAGGGAGSRGGGPGPAGSGPLLGAREEPAPEAVACDVCGAAMLEVHCRLLCPVCGYQRDCSDP